MAAFALSPSRTASGDEFDLISPVALPESPEARPRVPSWDRLPALVLDKEIDWSSSSTARSADWPRRPRHRSSASPPRSTATTKSPPRSVHLERKPKAKHGGIYSLLLKYKSPEQAPVLVDDLQSPDLAWAAAQSSVRAAVRLDSVFVLTRECLRSAEPAAVAPAVRRQAAARRHLPRAASSVVAALTAQV